MECRREAGLTQEDVSRALRLKSRQTVSSWERGASMPNVDEWYQLGPLYGKTLDYLVYGSIPIAESGSALMRAIFAPTKATV